MIAKENCMGGLWDEKEILALFKEVEFCKEKNLPIKNAFKSHAEKFARKPNSVRNYYYSEVEELKSDSVRTSHLGIDLSKHRKNEIAFFSAGEEEFVVGEIERMKEGGMSVRKACLTLAKGDAELMLRYQNKYRNRKAEKKENKVIEFRKPSKGLTDEEVQSLFMGLVRLVKKNALLEGEEKYRDKLKQANEKLKSLLSRIAMQEREIDKIKQSYLLLRKETDNKNLMLANPSHNKAVLLKNKLSKERSEKEVNKNL